MINRVVLVGRLTADPELRYTPSGVATCRFMLAVNRSFSNQQGEKETDFIKIQVWRKPAENTANFLKKGSLAGIEGRIQTGSYEGADGKKVYTTEVVADSVQFLEPRSGQSNNNSAAQGTNTQQNSTPQTNSTPNQQNYTRVDEDPFSSGSGPIEVSDDDLPF
jgi:single-strand DNA-binding protein